MQSTTLVPSIYFWVDEYNDKPEKMTAAFKWRGMCFGESYLIPEKKPKLKMWKNHLVEKIKEALDVIIHHGKNVLDSDNNINPDKVKNCEAERHYLDRYWKDKVLALRKIMLVKEITREQAVKLELL